uniref:Uncharacterized protein n=1 Tax=Anopheles atroparvus TaxID=41427 RepID=A0AAG5D8C2_ANOAO
MKFSAHFGLSIETSFIHMYLTFTSNTLFYGSILPASSFMVHLFIISIPLAFPSCFRPLISPAVERSAWRSSPCSIGVSWQPWEAGRAEPRRSARRVDATPGESHSGPARHDTCVDCAPYARSRS